MILKRDAGSDGLGDEGDVWVQRVCERVHMVGEYNNNSRNFANENKLDEAINALHRNQKSARDLLRAIRHITSCCRLLTSFAALPHLNFRLDIRRC